MNHLSSRYSDSVEYFTIGCIFKCYNVVKKIFYLRSLVLGLLVQDNNTRKLASRPRGMKVTILGASLSLTQSTNY